MDNNSAKNKKMNHHFDFLVDFSINLDELSEILIENPFYAGIIFADLGINLEFQAMKDKANNKPQLSNYLTQAAINSYATGVSLKNHHEIQTETIIKPHEQLITNIGQMTFDSISYLVHSFSKKYFSGEKHFHRTDILNYIGRTKENLDKAWTISKKHVIKITKENLSENYNNIVIIR